MLKTKKEDVVVKPTTPNCSRYGLRTKRNQKYSKFDEEYIIQCQEEIYKAVNQKSKKDADAKKTNKKVKKDDSKAPIKEIEYRTLEWQKDALYFSYEPNFLFLENDDGYVCECCDPKTNKKASSSEDNSEAEADPDDTNEDEECWPEGETSIPEETKPHAPGWFGKGRRRRGRTK